jgi:hypothetical protein
MTSFDNTLVGMVNIFIIITLEGWSDIMYMIRSTTDSYAYDFFFVIVVLLGNFFVLNLMIAVQFTSLQNSMNKKTNVLNMLDQSDEEDDDDSFEEGDDYGIEGDPT